MTIDSDSLHSIVDETFFCVEIRLVDDVTFFFKVEDAERPFDSESGAAIRFFGLVFNPIKVALFFIAVPFDLAGPNPICFFGPPIDRIEVAFFFRAVPFDSAGLLFNPIEVTDDSLGLTAVELRPATVIIVAVMG